MSCGRTVTVQGLPIFSLRPWWFFRAMLEADVSDSQDPSIHFESRKILIDMRICSSMNCLPTGSRSCPRVSTATLCPQRSAPLPHNSILVQVEQGPETCCGFAVCTMLSGCHAVHGREVGVAGSDVRLGVGALKSGQGEESACHAILDCIYGHAVWLLGIRSRGLCLADTRNWAD